MRQIVLVGMLLVVALSGCAEDGALTTDSTDTGDGGADAGDAAGSTDTGEAGQTVEEGADATLAVFAATASVQEGDLTAGEPFNVTIDSDLPDADAANATWTLDVVAGNDTVDSQTGSGVPATLNLTIVDAGNYTLYVLVSATGYEDANGSAALSVIEAVAPITYPDPQTISGKNSYPVGAFGLCGTSYPTYGPDIWGWKYTIEPAGHSPTWWDGDADTVDESPAGTVPEGTDNVGACPATGDAGASWTITVWPPGHPDAP